MTVHISGRHLVIAQNRKCRQHTSKYFVLVACCKTQATAKNGPKNMGLDKLNIIDS